MTPVAALFGYSPSGAVLTLVLPLGLFIVVMIGMTVVFRPGPAAPARQPAGRRAPSASAAAARIQPDDEDTVVHDTAGLDTAALDYMVSDTAEGAGAQDIAVSDRVGRDTPSADTVAGDAAATGPPEDAE